MSSAIDVQSTEVGQENPQALELDNNYDRYQRLDLLDRQSAETLNEFCRVNTRLDETATQLSDRAVLQAIATSIPLALADCLGLAGALLTAVWMVEAAFVGSVGQIPASTLALISLIILPIANVSGLYPGLGLGPAMEFRQVARALIASLLVFAGIGWFCFPADWFFYTASAAVAFALALPATASARFCARHAAKHVPAWGAPTLLVAEPDRGLHLYRRMQHITEQGFRPVGILLDPEEYWRGAEMLEREGVPVYDIRQTDEVAARLGVTWVVVSDCANRDVTPALDPSLAAIPNRILLSSNQLDLGLWDQLFCVGSSSGLRVGGSRPSSVQQGIKRALDVIFTLAAMIAGLPALLLICFLIRLSSRGPIFYSQTRIGRGGREFKAWKFRSMIPNADAVLERYLQQHPEARAEWDEKHKLAEDPRVTSIGHFLRKTSLDELPQLWNVLRGEMSLVGPRPIVDSPTYDAIYVHGYPEEFEVYKTVRPGLTGVWQVRCRNSGVYDLRIYWDMYYIRNWSVWLDLYLIMRTIKTVLLREGAH